MEVEDEGGKGKAVFVYCLACMVTGFLHSVGQLSAEFLKAMRW